MALSSRIASHRLAFASLCLASLRFASLRLASPCFASLRFASHPPPRSDSLLHYSVPLCCFLLTTHHSSTLPAPLPSYAPSPLHFSFFYSFILLWSPLFFESALIRVSALCSPAWFLRRGAKKQRSREKQRSRGKHREAENKQRKQRRREVEKSREAGK